jgi:hypothetical protein
MKHRVIISALWLLLFCVAIAPAQDADARRRAARYEPVMVQAGARYGVDPRLLWTIAFLETRFRPEMVSRVGARGLMQFMPATAARFRLNDPHDAAGSIDAAARYLRELQALFDRRLDLVLAAYNAGEGAVIAFRDGRKLILSNGKVINPNAIKTGGVPPYRETYSYVSDGIALYQRLIGSRQWPQGIQIARYRLPKGKSQEDITAPPLESMPEEIIQLKQGSVYYVDSIAGSEATAPPVGHPSLPRLPDNSTPRSIYPQ